MPHVLPGTVQAADYDLGRLGTAYSDTYAARVDYRNLTPHNQGNAYRNDGVDIEAVADAASGGSTVGHMATDEWLNYTVTVPQATTFTVQARLMNPAGTPARLMLMLMLDNKQAIGNIEAAAGSAWYTAPAGTVTLPAGTHILHLSVEQPGAVISWLQFVATAVCGY